MNVSKSILTFTLASLLLIGCKGKTSETIPASTIETNASKVKKEIASANLQTASLPSTE